MKEEIMSYATKSCNICGWKDIQPNMYRTEKSRVSGSSKTKITSGNLVGFALGQKNSKRKISNTLFANNKREYTRKTVLSDARATGWLSKPAPEATQLQMAKKIESLRVLEGETFNGVQQQAKDLVEELESMYRIGLMRKEKADADSTLEMRSNAREQARLRANQPKSDEQLAIEKKGMRNLAYGLVGAAIVVVIHAINSGAIA